MSRYKLCAHVPPDILLRKNLKIAGFNFSVFQWFEERIDVIKSWLVDQQKQMIALKFNNLRFFFWNPVNGLGLLSSLFQQVHSGQDNSWFLTSNLSRYRILDCICLYLSPVSQEIPTGNRASQKKVAGSWLQSWSCFSEVASNWITSFITSSLAYIISRQNNFKQLKFQTKQLSFKQITVLTQEFHGNDNLR